MSPALVKRRKLKKIGFEPLWLNLDQHQKLKDLLPLGASLLPLPGVVENLRMTKSPEEIDRIRKSVRVNSEAYARTLRRVRLGMRERDIAAELDYQMRLHGAEKPAFDTIVAAGYTYGAAPCPAYRQTTGRKMTCADRHGSVSRRLHERHDPGGLPGHSHQARPITYNAVLEAQMAGIEAVRPGVTAARVDEAARKVLKRHGLDRQFVHSPGMAWVSRSMRVPESGKRTRPNSAPGW